MGLMATWMRRVIAEVRGTWVGPITANSPEIARLFGAPPTTTGVAVSEHTALTYSAIWAAVSVIASQVASLPLILYKRLPTGGKERLLRHPLYRLLHDEPNSEMTALVFRETLQAHVLLWGNAYAEIERDGSGRPVALWPLPPDRVTPYRESAGLRLRYRVRSADVTGRDVLFDPIDMLHIPGLGYDGTCGYSVIGKARESIGLGLAAERFGGTFFGNGSTFGGVLEHPKQLGEIAQKNLRQAIEARHQGVDRAHRFLILEEGMQYKRTGIPPNDAQFIETRKFQIADVCRWFNIPPHKLRDLERATFSNIEQQSIEFVTDTLRPWLVRWEQELNRKLVAPTERNIQFAEHLVDGLLRGDIASRYAAYAVGRQWGWLSADDVREKENMNPLPDGSGQQYLVPLNMVPAGRMDEVIDKQVAPAPPPPAPAPPPVPEEDDEEDDDDRSAILADLNERLMEAHRHQDEARAEAAAEREARALVEQHAVLTATERAVLAEREQAAQARVEETTARLAALEAQVDALEAARAATTAQHEAALAQATREAESAAHREAEADARARAALLAADTAQQELVALRERLDEDIRSNRALALEEQAALVARLAEAEAQSAATAAAAERAQTVADEALRAREAATEARVQILTELESHRASEAARVSSVVAAHRALFVDAAGRLLRIEADRARRAQATPEKLRRWIETFYPIHEDVCRMAFLAPLRAHLAWMQSEADPGEVAAAMAAQHVAESRRQLRLVLETEAGDVNESLETVLRRWETDRADHIADQVLQEAVTYVRTTTR
jgi:HK97 family phage portal protein